MRDVQPDPQRFALCFLDLLGEDARNERLRVGAGAIINDCVLPEERTDAGDDGAGVGAMIEAKHRALLLMLVRVESRARDAESAVIAQPHSREMTGADRAVHAGDVDTEFLGDFLRGKPLVLLYVGALGCL